jgi:hypothetical protein
MHAGWSFVAGGLFMIAAAICVSSLGSYRGPRGLESEAIIPGIAALISGLLSIYLVNRGLRSEPGGGGS